MTTASFVRPDMFSQNVEVWPFGALTPQTYGLIMIDPPWRFETYSDKGRGKSVERHYETMKIEDIAALPVGDLATSNCLLWMWATAPMLPQQLAVMAAWGFGYKSSGVWVKRTVNGLLGFGTGYGFRGSHEIIVLGQRGAPMLTHSVRSVIEGPIRENSRKPDEAYAAAEQLVPHVRRADVFSRETRPGWDACGHEAGNFDEGDDQ